MRKIARFSLALVACIGGLHVLTASAATSADLRPVAQSKQVVYESYISNSDCVEKQDYGSQFSGLGSVFLGAQQDPLGKKMNLECPTGYALVTMTSESSGGFQSAAGGRVSNNGTAKCCPIKHRWASPQTAA